MRFHGEWMLVGAGMVFAGCATRSVPDRFPPQSAASLEARAAEPARVTTSLEQDPPLPGEPISGWSGLQSAEGAQDEGRHDHEHDVSEHDMSEHDMHEHNTSEHDMHEQHKRDHDKSAHPGHRDKSHDNAVPPDKAVPAQPKSQHDHSQHGAQP